MDVVALLCFVLVILGSDGAPGIRRGSWIGTGATERDSQNRLAEVESVHAFVYIWKSLSPPK